MPWILPFKYVGLDKGCPCSEIVWQTKESPSPFLRSPSPDELQSLPAPRLEDQDLQRGLEGLGRRVLR